MTEEGCRSPLLVPRECDPVGADKSSLLRDALCLGTGGEGPGRPRVVDGDGVGGGAAEVVVGLVHGRMREIAYDVLLDIEVGNCGGERREGRSGSVSLVDDLPVANELLFVFGSHWNEGAKTEEVSTTRRYKKGKGLTRRGCWKHTQS